MQGTLLAASIAVWVLLDQASKAFFAKVLAHGAVIGPFAGVFQFALVHNTGGAWGVFSNSTFALGCFSLVVCAALVAYALYDAAQMCPAETIGLGLVVAGGIGNAIDRFALGYVVDFIDPVFIEFPVFNIADIGVTCGFALFVIAYLLRNRAQAKRMMQDGALESRLGEGE